MPKFSYVAMDSRGKETKGTLDVNNQNEAIGRLKEMGFFPTKVVEVDKTKEKAESKTKGGAKGAAGGKKKGALDMSFNLKIPGLSRQGEGEGVDCIHAPACDTCRCGFAAVARPARAGKAGEEQNAEGGLSGSWRCRSRVAAPFQRALRNTPKVFNRLFVNMVKAGELGGVLEVVLARLADFMEKAQKIKGKVIAAMFYPTAVMTVAVVILGVLMVFVVPKFKEIFKDMLPGQGLPAFTRFVLGVSDAIANNFIVDGDLRRCVRCCPDRFC
jgi:type IV pilus assembly protein PilC